MAEKKNQQVSGGIMMGDDGYLFVRGLEDKVLDSYLSTYAARIAGYKVEPGESFTRVTMKLEFPVADDRNNVNLWTFFIAQQAHKVGKKVTIIVEPAQQGFVSYCSWPIWNNVKYMESKGKGSTSW